MHAGGAQTEAESGTASTSAAAMQRVLRAVQESLVHESRAQQEMVWLLSMRVLDALQWCRVALALHPLHCDLEPLLHVLASLPL